MVMRDFAFRTLLALLLVLSGSKAMTSDAMAALVSASSAIGSAVSPQEHSMSQGRNVVAARQQAKTQPPTQAKMPCSGGDCPDMVEKAMSDCSGALTNCMPIGVLENGKTLAARAWVRTVLSAAASSRPSLSQWVLDPPPPRS